MKTQKINHTRIIPMLLMALAFIGLSSLTARADADNGNECGAIAGLWHNHFVSYYIPPFETYSQWHSDGLEIDTPNFAPGVCMGTFRNVGGRTFKLFHVGWTPGGIPGHAESVRFELRELNTVSHDRNRFDGTYDQKFFDANGNLVAEDMGTIHSTRLTVH